jgi:hypothetical protein
LDIHENSISEAINSHLPDGVTTPSFLEVRAYLVIPEFLTRNLPQLLIQSGIRRFPAKGFALARPPAIAG